MQSERGTQELFLPTFSGITFAEAIRINFDARPWDKDLILVMGTSPKYIHSRRTQ